MSSKIISGQMRCAVPFVVLGKKYRYESHNYDYMNNLELAQGWRRKLPKKQYKKVMKNVVNKKGKMEMRNISVPVNYYSTIILSQLPDHLWDRIHTEVVYDKGVKVEKYYAKDGFYNFVIKETPFDEQIHELYTLVMKYPDADLKRMSELLEILKENDIGGWLVMRAIMMVKGKNITEHIIDALPVME